MPIDDALENIQGTTLEERERIIEEASKRLYDVESILNGEIFYSDERDNDGNYIGLSIALEQALDYASNGGIVLTMPELIAAKIKADKDHNFWNDSYSVHTEENIGIDKKGIHYGVYDQVLVIVNGGGILTLNRIIQAYDEDLIDGSVKYTDDEFDDLLKEKLPNGDSINLYKFEEIKDGISNLPHRFGVVMPYSMVKGSIGWHKKIEFMENPLVIARAGGIENLEAYHGKAKDLLNGVGNWHVYENRDPSPPQGRVLRLNDYELGLGNFQNLNGIGRFIGVAP